MHPPEPIILVVDDTQINLITLRHLLRDVEARVIEASSGAQALKMAHQVELALALLDVQMPEMDGYELAARLKQETHNNEVPIIFLTAAYHDEHHQLKGYHAGAADYIEKPINRDILLSKLDVFLRLWRSKAELRKLLAQVDEKNRRLQAEINERRQAERALKESEQKLKAITNATREAIILLDERGRITFWNLAAADLFGYSAEQALGLEFAQQFSAAESRAQYQSHFEVFRRTGKGPLTAKHIEFEACRRDGSHFPVELSMTTVDITGCWHALGVLQDISERKAIQQQLEWQVAHDTLTSAYSRLKFDQLLDAACKRSHAENTPISLIMFDVDHFKQINDQYNHVIGDQVLIEVVRLMESQLQDSDYLVRWGGEEFMILSPGLSLQQACAVAEQCRQHLSRHVFEQVRQITASFGVTELKPDEDREQTLIRVDKALYQAKHKGRNRVECLS